MDSVLQRSRPSERAEVSSAGRLVLLRVPRPDDLPDFRDPPIDEVVVGLSFEPIDGFADVHTGLLWQRLRSEYPRTQGRPRHETPIEDLTAGLTLPVLPAFELIGPNDSVGGRSWFISEDDSALLQIQNTQFMRNWRRRDGEYPRLEDHVAEFWKAYDEFCRLLTEEGMSEPKVRQLELTYFNWISPGDPDFFVPVRAGAVGLNGLGPDPEDARMMLSYFDYGESDVPVARLRVELQGAIRPDGDHLVSGQQLVLSYRAPVIEPTRDQLNEIIQRGRKAIDYSFVDLTSEAAQTRWGRFK